MSSGPGEYLLQRRREARLRRFGLVLGGVLALLFHLAVFWGPKVGYRPVLEQARVRRVLVARPYQPVPTPPPPTPVAPPKPSPRAKAGPVAPPAPTPKPAPAVPPAPVVAPKPEASQDTRRSVAEVPATAADAVKARPKGADDATRAPAQAPASDWDQLLASMQDRKQDIAADRARRRQEIEQAAADTRASQTQWGGGGQDEDGGGYLDSRVRMTVVSYPPTSIEQNYLEIPYPDLRFKRTQLEAGFCRVWYRVWLDGRGEIVRDQLKTPSTEAERELYAEFITRVKESVAEWPFPRQQAEVHVDVVFQIE